MSNLDYMPVECLFIPKVLFREERYRSLSTTAKVLYSLLLGRLDYAALNGWIDDKRNAYVLYPKSEMKNDLNCTRYRVDEAVAELEKMGNLVRIVKENGRPNRFYINDITKMEENAMMRMDTLLDAVSPEEREEIMRKIAETAGEIVEGLVAKGYVKDVQQEGAVGETSVLERPDPEEEDFDLDAEAIEEEAGEFAMDLAFGVLETFEDIPGRVEEIQRYFNWIHKTASMKKFMAVVETTAVLCGNSREWLEVMYACKKAERRIYLAELVKVFNFYLNMALKKETE